MKAIVQDRYGPPSVLRFEDIPVPVPDATSVLVKVRSASVNALDWRILEGRPVVGRLFFGLRRPKRRVRGVDVAGEVVAVKKSDSRFKPGDAVFGLASGSFAEYAPADEGEIVAKPPGVSFDDAATLGVAAFTALQGLRARGPLRDGASVAITAAASGVGVFAVQLAKWMGARVTAITSTGSVDLVRSIGADAVVDYQTQDFTQNPDRFDLILDVGGRESYRDLERVLAPHGHLVVIGSRGGLGRIMSAGLRRRLLRKPTHTLMAKPRIDDFALLANLLAEGKVKPVIDRSYQLSEVPAAMTRALLHRARGKLVIRVS